MNIINNLETTVEFAVNKQWLGKPIKSISEDGRAVQTYLSKEVYIGHYWINISATFEEAFLLLCEGYSVAPKLLDDSQPKNDLNFASHQMLLIDFDNGATIPEILADAVAQKFCSGYYTTVSHQSESPRFRLIFLLENPISDREDMKKLYKYFLRRYKACDQSCKDSSRLFYGVIDPMEAEIFNKVLPQKAVRIAIANQEKYDLACEEQLKKEASMKNTTTGSFKELTSEQSFKIIELLNHQVDSIPYNSWLSFCWNYKSLPNVSLADLINTSNIRYGDSKGCSKLWADKRTGNIGVLINIIKKERGKHVLDFLTA